MAACDQWHTSHMWDTNTTKESSVSTNAREITRTKRLILKDTSGNYTPVQFASLGVNKEEKEKRKRKRRMITIKTENSQCPTGWGQVGLLGCLWS